MQEYIIDGLRTPMGKAGGALAAVRPDDLAAHVSEILRRNPDIEPVTVEDIFWGATNEAADDARNVARIAALLAGLPMYELARRGGGRGLATMCIGVGQGISVALEVY